MTLDKQMVYRVYLKDGTEKYHFQWDQWIQQWNWKWPGGFAHYVSLEEMKELLSLCEHFPEYRTLTISPRRGIELRGEPASG